jgi:hypothetical protein
MYFHTDSPDTTARLGEAVTRADLKGRLRLDVDDKGRLRYKVGEGMWSEPIESTPDLYRDEEVSNHIVVDAEAVRPGDLLTAFGNAEVLWVVDNSEFFTRIGFKTPHSDGTPAGAHVILSDVAPVSVRRKV